MTYTIGWTALALSRWIELSILSKITVVLVLGLLAVRLSGRARASVRHLIVTATFGTLLLVPLVAVISPAVRIELPPLRNIDNSANSESVISSPNPSRVPASPIESTSSGGRGWSMPSLATMIRLAWLGGTLLMLVSIGADFWRLRRLRRDGLPWMEIGDLNRSLAAECGIGRAVEVLLHAEIQAPLTCGIRRPVILLPADAREWTDADLRRALVHELEHIRRCDWAVQVTARAICAGYWFHPLVWTAWRRLCVEAERACDDAVLQSAERTEYASQLVSLARGLSKSRALPMLGMANRSDLSTRICALLDGNQRRGRAGLFSVSIATAIAGVVVLAIGPVSAVTRSLDATGDVANESVKLADAASTRNNQKEAPMRINLTSVMVDDQEKALTFYTEILGFKKKTEVPIGDYKWLTVVSPEGPGDVELLLEPMGFPPARTYQKALFEGGIPATSFAVDDIQREYDRLVNLGVVFKQKPTQMGPVTVAIFEDTCGNLIQIAQKL